jgi:hypothetical protein
MKFLVNILIAFLAGMIAQSEAISCVVGRPGMSTQVDDMSSVIIHHTPG